MRRRRRRRRAAARSGVTFPLAARSAASIAAGSGAACVNSVTPRRSSNAANLAGSVASSYPPEIDVEAFAPRFGGGEPRLRLRPRARGVPRSGVVALERANQSDDAIHRRERRSEFHRLREHRSPHRRRRSRHDAREIKIAPRRRARTIPKSSTSSRDSAEASRRGFDAATRARRARDASRPPIVFRRARVASPSPPRDRAFPRGEADAAAPIPRGSTPRLFSRDPRAPIARATRRRPRPRTRARRPSRRPSSRRPSSRRPSSRRPRRRRWSSPRAGRSRPPGARGKDRASSRRTPPTDAREARERIRHHASHPPRIRVHPPRHTTPRDPPPRARA